MKITKYEHACLDITEGNTRIVIDPGKFSTSLTDYQNINGVVITHIHSDHFVKENVLKIIEQNPEVQVFTNQQVANEIQNSAVTIAKAGDTAQVKDATLSFYGGQHEFYGEFENIAVMINDKLYHPGDSYTVPNKQFEVLAAPASAPWLRVRDASDFIVKCKPKIAFPIHNMILSPEGEEIHYRALKAVCDENNIEWQVLTSGESLTV